MTPATGVIFGIVATASYASAKGWAVVIPPLAWAGGLGATLVIGAAAGLCPRSAPPACRPPRRCGPCNRPCPGAARRHRGRSGRLPQTIDYAYDLARRPG